MFWELAEQVSHVGLLLGVTWDNVGVLISREEHDLTLDVTKSPWLLWEEQTRGARAEAEGPDQTVRKMTGVAESMLIEVPGSGQILGLFLRKFQLDLLMD